MEKDAPIAPIPAVIYCRISADPEGRAIGVERQEADCRALAERLGMKVGAVVVDNDLSASTSSHKPRPQYEAVLRQTRAGQFGAILAYSNSRLTRRPREFEDLLDLHNATGVRIVTVVSGEDNLATADGRMVARFKAVADAAEAERIAERVRRAKRQAVEEGRYRGGRRPYGYKKDGVTILEKEAQVIRDATKAVLAGRSLLSIARELQEAGHTTSTGARFTHIALRELLTRPRNAGLMSKGSAGRAGFQILGPASWEPIVDEDTWRACFNVLFDPSRRSHRGTEPKWLGSSTYFCGAPGCTGTMRAAAKTNDRDADGNRRARRDQYRCREANHVTITAVPTDEFVKQTVAEVLRDERIVKALTTHEGEPNTHAVDRERRSVLVRQIDQLQAEWDNDDIGTQDYNRKKAKKEAEIAEIDARLALGMQQAAVNPVLLAPDPASAFLNAPVDIQRALLRLVLRVEVLPATKIGAAWTSDRLRITPAYEGAQ